MRSLTKCAAVEQKARDTEGETEGRRRNREASAENAGAGKIRERAIYAGGGTFEAEGEGAGNPPGATSALRRTLSE